MRHAKKFAVGVLIIMSLSAFAAIAGAQQQPAPLVVHSLKDNISWIEGGGGNTGVIVGQDGVIIIDAKVTVAAGKEILDDVAKLTPKPVTHVLITHSDADHVTGLASFPMGLTIIAQENCKKEMEASLSSKNPAPSDHMPTKTVGDKESLTIDGVLVQLFHWVPAHTSGDMVVYLPDQKVVFTGDIVATQTPYPRIHMEKNGSSEGWITTMKGVLALNADTFVPGHGDLQTKADLQKRLADAQARREEIKKMVAQGKSLDQIKQAVGEPNPSGLTYPSFTEVVYTELTKKN